MYVTPLGTKKPKFHTPTKSCPHPLILANFTHTLKTFAHTQHEEKTVRTGHGQKIARIRYGPRIASTKYGPKITCKRYGPKIAHVGHGPKLSRTRRKPNIVRTWHGQKLHPRRAWAKSYCVHKPWEKNNPHKTWGKIALTWGKMCIHQCTKKHAHNVYGRKHAHHQCTENAHLIFLLIWIRHYKNMVY